MVFDNIVDDVIIIVISGNCKKVLTWQWNDCIPMKIIILSSIVYSLMSRQGKNY